MNSSLGLAKGALSVTLLDNQGNVKQRQTISNKIVMTGCNLIASALSGEGENVRIALPSHIACGTGTNAPTVNDNALYSEVARVPFDVAPKRTDNNIEYEATFGPGVPNAENVAITEVGIFNSASEGVMLNRATFAQVNKQIEDTVIINWVVTILSDEGTNPAADTTALNEARLDYSTLG